jgi:protein TonB
MHSLSRQSWRRHTLWLSLLGHLLFLLSFLVMVRVAPHELPSAQAPASIPSYLSPSPAPSPESPPAPEPIPQPEPKPEPKQLTEAKTPPKEQAKDGIEAPIPKAATQAKAAPKSKSSRSPHTPTFSRDAVPEDMTNPRDQEPLRLVGENKIIKPLVKILARALSQHLRYPRVAADFNLRGVVVVGFVLNPEGYVTETRVMQSSGAGVLDDAARDAVGAMSPVGDVHEYVSAPEFLVIGIIFG